ncbi:kelch motif protein (macronuclear) [Tetrahymena thermophila SB210]|uniref:Kelch motif protein n=1 Tax=Tetrahymena thermophila (strain SB210) TaxID=312017 RepID=Q22UZ3_TETTS|nr:kelch motif protein [Tetrahymena thermophila SB210]EAR89155.2 kelch motif protein [Tetrahymena thermophila SB210]|eukprot:XP_001009400.2 kelch motif protein [Tetrahymena thermophila SB210]
MIKSARNPLLNSSSLQSASNRQSEEKTNQLEQNYDGSENKKEQKKSLFDNQNSTQQSNQNSISSSSTIQAKDQQDEEEPIAKEKGFFNYFEAYYHGKNGETIFKNYFQPQVFANEMKKNKLKISDLTITKYNSSIIQREEDKNGYSYFNENMNNSAFLKSVGCLKVNFTPIFSLPRIQYQELDKDHNQNEGDLKTRKFITQGIEKNSSGFVSFDKIKDMNEILLSTIEKDFQEQYKSQSSTTNLLKLSKDLFLSKSDSKEVQSNYNSTRSFMEKSFNQIGDKSYIKNSYYSNKQKLKYTLQHNKFHENQLKMFDMNEQMKSIQRLQNIIEQQQQIIMKQQYRKYPSSHITQNQKNQFLIQDISQQIQDRQETDRNYDTIQVNQKPGNNQNKDMLGESLRSFRSIFSIRGSIASPESPSSPKRISIMKSISKNQTKNQSPKSKIKKNLANLIPCYILRNEEVKWKPEVRELFKIAFNGATIYMYGGCASKPMSDLCTYDVQTNHWSLVDKLPAEEGRYNHMMAMYKKNLIVFGGEKLDAQYEQKQKVYQNDTRIFNTEKNEWKYLRPSGDIIEPRRNSACCVVGRYFIIQGGLNQKGVFLNDLCILDIANQRWSFDLHEDRYSYMLQGRAFHKACPVYHPDKKHIDLFKDSTEKMSEKQLNEVKHEGIYFFGGQLQNGEASNQLSILVTSTRPMHFIQPQTIGKKPEPRYNHSLTYNSKLKILVVYGGMNENLQNDQTFYDDLFILQLNDLQWFECATVGFGLQNRANHEAVCFDTQLLIFGGIGEQGFYSFEVLKIELDKYKSRKYIIEHQMNEKQREIQALKKAKTIKGNLNTSSIKRQEKVKEHEEFIKNLQLEQAEIKNKVDKLNFKNYKSFMPLPIIFTRKKEISMHKQDDSLKKDKLDLDIQDHVESDRKINDQMLKSCSPSPTTSRKGLGTPKIGHSSSLQIQEQKLNSKFTDSQNLKRMQNSSYKANNNTQDFTSQVVKIK